MILQGPWKISQNIKTKSVEVAVGLGPGACGSPIDHGFDTTINYTSVKTIMVGQRINTILTPSTSEPLLVMTLSNPTRSPSPCFVFLAPPLLNHRISI